MERPSTGWKFHLLMILHQQMQEARRLGNLSARLEFLESPSELLIRVVGSDPGEGFEFGGVYQVDELVRRPGDTLRELEADGLVRVNHRSEDSGSGEVEITQEGMRQVRLREAYAAGRPRYSGMWEVFPGRGVVRHKRLWRANWDGLEITVKNWRVLFGPDDGRRTEYLSVGLRPPANYRSVRTRFAKDLYGDLEDRDGRHSLHAHVGLTAPLLRTGCIISIDGVAIGGDLSKRFVT